jgi:hypothetical protein
MFVYKLFLLILSASTSTSDAYSNSKVVQSRELLAVQIRDRKNTQSLQKGAVRYAPKDTVVEKTKQVEQEQLETTQKLCGSDTAHGEEYWYDQRIHMLGNVGFWGAVHAACAPASTKLIDIMAYDGMNIRQKVRHTNITVCVSSLFLLAVRILTNEVLVSLLTFLHPRCRGNYGKRSHATKLESWISAVESEPAHGLCAMPFPKPKRSLVWIPRSR